MSHAIPQDRFFSKEHEWVKITQKQAVMGISDHAQSALGDVVYVELPKIGTKITEGMPIGLVESVKAVSDIYAPVSGVVKNINQNAISDPGVINKDPYGAGWLLEIELTNSQERGELLDAKAYEAMLEEEAK